MLLTVRGRFVGHCDALEADTQAAELVMLGQQLERFARLVVKGASWAAA